MFSMSSSEFRILPFSHGRKDRKAIKERLRVQGLCSLQPRRPGEGHSRSACDARLASVVLFGFTVNIQDASSSPTVQ